MVRQDCETRLNHGLVINHNGAIPILATHKGEEMMKVAVRFNQQNLPPASQSSLFSQLFFGKFTHAVGCWQSSGKLAHSSLTQDELLAVILWATA